jgi:hypothetical protein
MGGRYHLANVIFDSRLTCTPASLVPRVTFAPWSSEEVSA